MAIAHRDDAQLVAGFLTWYEATHPGHHDVRVEDLRRPSAGWSNETVLLTVSAAAGAAGRSHERLVLRLPTVEPTYPVYDLGAQAAVLAALDRAGIPTARVVAFEPDATALGLPFLVMAHVDGRPGAEAPGLDPWLMEAPVADQRAVHERLLTTLARIHRVDWRGLGLAAVLRGAAAGLADELAWWSEYVDWAADGTPARVLRAAMDWCAATAPAATSAPSLCWGDARLGNVMFGEQREIVAVLDWELASIGPAEMDLAWYLALDRLTSKFSGAVPGFLDRDAAIAHYEQALGRPVVDLDWHEIFALVRSTAINDRQARMAQRAGADYPGIPGDDNPMLGYLTRRIDRSSAGRA
jgi:aminoglycoside phosphotransferase (APT) family kinase protein